MVFGRNELQKILKEKGIKSTEDFNTERCDSRDVIEARWRDYRSSGLPEESEI